MASNTRLRDDEGVFWKIFSETKEELKARSFLNDRKLLRPKVLKRFADHYKVPVASINPNAEASIYTSVSLVMTLLFPRNKQAAQDLNREIERGKLAFMCAVEIARGKIRSREQYVQPGSTVIKKTAIELDNLLHSVCELASRHGYSREEISDALRMAKERLDENGLSASDQ